MFHYRINLINQMNWRGQVAKYFFSWKIKWHLLQWLVSALTENTVCLRFIHYSSVLGLGVLHMALKHVRSRSNQLPYTAIWTDSFLVHFTEHYLWLRLPLDDCVCNFQLRSKRIPVTHESEASGFTRCDQKVRKNSSFHDTEFFEGWVTDQND